MIAERRTEGTGGMRLLPPKPGVCQVCAVDHKPEEAHDAQSLYYQYAFYANFRRWPTWADAIAHCSKSVRKAWERLLRKGGFWSEPTADQGPPIAWVIADGQTVAPAAKGPELVAEG